jgi:hypothetical protein
MQINPVVEWQRLCDLYREKSDEELLELAADCLDLTETAREVLSGEMRKRGLDAPPAENQARAETEPPAEAPGNWRGEAEGGAVGGEDSEGAEESAGPHEYTWKTVLCGCDTQEEARQLTEALKRAGIESWIESPGSYSPYAQLEMSSPRILVAADRLEEARRIAAQPIAQEIVDQCNRLEPEYEAPVCPQCGAGDPVLEGVDAVNRWRCEACGRRWTEAEGSRETGGG